MYENWKILKSEVEEKQEEYTEVAEWCNDGQEYHIDLYIDENDVEWYRTIKNPEPLPPTKEELDAQNANRVRSIRGEYMAETLNKVERYETQKAVGLDTTESEDTYRNYLLYLQYLRDVPQSADFPNIEVLTFDKWVEGC